jgi:hypothetical protein
MDPNQAAFPHTWTEETQEVSAGISYRQWMIGKVAGGYLANPSIDLEEVRCSGPRKDEVVAEIIAIADELIEEEDAR